MPILHHKYMDPNLIFNKCYKLKDYSKYTLTLIGCLENMCVASKHTSH